MYMYLTHATCTYIHRGVVRYMLTIITLSSTDTLQQLWAVACLCMAVAIVGAARCTCMW